MRWLPSPYSDSLLRRLLRQGESPTSSDPILLWSLWHSTPQQVAEWKEAFVRSQQAVSQSLQALWPEPHRGDPSTVTSSPGFTEVLGYGSAGLSPAGLVSHGVTGQQVTQAASLTSTGQSSDSFVVTRRSGSAT